MLMLFYAINVQPRQISYRGAYYRRRICDLIIFCTITGQIADCSGQYLGQKFGRITYNEYKCHTNAVTQIGIS